MEDHQQDQQDHKPALYNVTKGQFLLTSGALAASGLADLAMHMDKNMVFFGLLGAGVVAHQSNAILDLLIPGRDSAHVAEQTEHVLNRVSPDPEYDDQDVFSKLKRLFTLKSPGYAAEPFEDFNEEEYTGDEQEEEGDELVPEEPVREHRSRRLRRDYIDLSPHLQIAKKDLVGKAIFICGIRRHGKTTLGARIAEQFGKHYIPMLIPDAEGDYMSLVDILPRAVVAAHSSADAAYQNYEFAALDTAEAAFQLGYAILELGYQVLLDMTSYASLDIAVMIQVNVIRGMFQWANTHPEGRCPACVYLDEAQRYLPERLSDSVIKNKELVQGLLDAYMDITAIGGKRGINPIILTQRFAQVNKKIMAQSEVFFLMRQTMDNDLTRCMEYVHAPVTQKQISEFGKGQGVYIATDGTQVVTQFHQRESSGNRSSSPDAEVAQRYASMPMHPAPIYTQQAPVKAKTPIYTATNASVNGSTSDMEPLPPNPRLHLLVNGKGPEMEPEEAEIPSVNVNVNAETREIIRRLVGMGVLKHGQIAKAVKLDGRNYPIYKQICREMGIMPEKEV